MGLLASQLSGDCALIFSDLDSIPGMVAATYTPLGGTPRAINVLLVRNPPQRFNAKGEDVTPRLEFACANDATLGITAGGLNAFGNDKLTVSYRGVSRDFGIYLPDPSAGEFEGDGFLILDLK